VEIYDIIMLVVLVGATLFGAWKGLAWQIAFLTAIVVSSFVAIKFPGPVAAILPAEPPWGVPLARLILFVGTSFVIWLAFQAASAWIDRLRLQEFDLRIGTMFGLANGILICAIVTVFLMSLVETLRPQIRRSYSAYYIAVMLDKAHAYMPEDMHDALEPAFHSLDRRLGERGQPHHGVAAIQLPSSVQEKLTSSVNSVGQHVRNQLQNARR